MQGTATGDTLLYSPSAATTSERLREQRPLFVVPTRRTRDRVEGEPLSATSLPASHETRKKLGAWYTPLEISRHIVRWAVRAPGVRILDPSVGDGDFLLEAAERLAGLGQPTPSTQLFGVDVNVEAVLTTERGLVRKFGPGARLLVDDFFDLDPPGDVASDLPPVDVIVGNPPYIRYQRFTGRNRAVAARRARDAGVQLSDLASSWAAFVVHATSFLSPGGRLALVLPEELVHANYAGQVRSFLRRVFRSTALIDFDSYRFPRAQERVVLLLAEGKLLAPVGELRLARVPHPACIQDIDDVLAAAEVYPPSEHPEKWHVGSADVATRVLDQLAAEHSLVPLGAVGTAGIGYVSGANGYFVLRPSEALARGIPAEVTRPTILAARQVRGAQITSDDLASMLARNEQCLLWTGEGTEIPAVNRYIDEGIELGVAERYKCRMRDPWYVVPGATVPDAFLTYMSHEIPRLVANGANITCSNNFLAVRFRDMNPAQICATVVSFYNSATVLSAERVGRHYGGGVLKLEPSEASRVLIPNLAHLNVDLMVPLLDKVDGLLRARRTGEALQLIDRVVLGEGFGLEPDRIRLIQEAWHERRHSRAGLGKNISRDSP